MSVIEVKDLTKDYGFGRGVFDVSFSINKGEVFGFLGPNGAGKSTTIRHLMGFSKLDKGETLIFEKPTFDRYYEILSHVGYIPGEIALPHNQVTANIKNETCYYWCSFVLHRCKKIREEGFAFVIKNNLILQNR